jgi:hypothetical protein
VFLDAYLREPLDNGTLAEATAVQDILFLTVTIVELDRHADDRLYRRVRRRGDARECGTLLGSKFGEALPAVRKAMKTLARSMPPERPAA